MIRLHTINFLHLHWALQLHYLIVLSILHVDVLVICVGIYFIWTWLCCFIVGQKSFVLWQQFKYHIISFVLDGVGMWMVIPPESLVPFYWKPNMIRMLTLYIPLKKVSIKLTKHKIEPIDFLFLLPLLLTIFTSTTSGHHVCFLTINLMFFSFPVPAMSQGPYNGCG